MLRKLALSGAALSAFAAQAVFAADLPSRKAPPPPPPVPVFTWTGFYLGFNSGFGGGISNANIGLAGPGAFVATNTGNRASGSVVGGQIGYNYQFGNVVLGLESEVNWSEMKASHQALTTASTGAAGFTYANIEHGINWFGATRARLGYSIGRVLPYITGGVAYGEVEANGVQAAGGALIGGSSTQTKVGWAAGAGAEVAVSDRVSARAEYVYVELPGVSGPAVGFTPAPFPSLIGNFSTGSLGTHIIRGGANWKFNGFGDLARVTEGNLFASLLAPATSDWSGLYAGVVGGYGGGNVDADVPLASPAPFASNTLTRNRFGGFVAGGHLGYNLQIANHYVVGVETDAQWSDMKAWHQATTGPAPFVFTDTKNGLSWFGSTRARLGYAFADVLYFATGGVAYGELYANGSQVEAGIFSGGTSTFKAGWTVGGGAEYALTPNLSLRADYLYVSFSGVSAPSLGFGVAPFVGAFSTGTFGANISRVGLNWRFGGGARTAPVLAKY